MLYFLKGISMKITYCVLSKLSSKRFVHFSVTQAIKIIKSVALLMKKTREIVEDCQYLVK